MSSNTEEIVVIPADASELITKKVRRKRVAKGELKDGQGEPKETPKKARKSKKDVEKVVENGEVKDVEKEKKQKEKKEKKENEKKKEKNDKKENEKKKEEKEELGECPICIEKYTPILRKNMYVNTVKRIVALNVLSVIY